MGLITIIRLNFNKNYQVKYFNKTTNFKNINIIYSLYKETENDIIFKIKYKITPINKLSNILNPRFEFVQQLLLINPKIFKYINPKCTDYQKNKRIIWVFNIMKIKEFDDIVKNLLLELTPDDLKKSLIYHPQEIRLFKSNQFSFEFYNELIIANPEIFKWINSDYNRYNELKEIYGFLCQ
jgi:hypothetical protein